MVYHFGMPRSWEVQKCENQNQGAPSAKVATKNSHQKPPKSPVGGISPSPLNETCWASNSVWKIGIISLIWITQSKESISKIAEITKNDRFSIGRTLDCVIRMKRMIPIFHTEFDAKQVSSNRLGEIPPSGDFGGFLWLLLLAISRWLCDEC